MGTRFCEQCKYILGIVRVEFPPQGIEMVENGLSVFCVFTRACKRVDDDCESKMVANDGGLSQSQGWMRAVDGSPRVYWANDAIRSGQVHKVECAVEGAISSVQTCLPNLRERPWATGQSENEMATCSNGIAHPPAIVAIAVKPVKIKTQVTSEPGHRRTGCHNRPIHLTASSSRSASPLPRCGILYAGNNQGWKLL